MSAARAEQPPPAARLRAGRVPRPRPPREMTMPVLVLTGGPAVGKTTCGRRLAGARPRGAFIDVDDIRQLVVAGAAAPWEGEEGAAQRLLGARNSAALALNFVDRGFDVVIADVLTPTTADLYRELLPSCRIVRLVLTDDEARMRARSRPAWLTDEEFAELHRIDRADPPPADITLGVDLRTVDEQTELIRGAWLGSPE